MKKNVYLCSMEKNTNLENISPENLMKICRALAKFDSDYFFTQTLRNDFRDSVTDTLDWVKYTYILLTAEKMAKSYADTLDVADYYSLSLRYDLSVDEDAAAKLCRAWKLIDNDFYHIRISPSVQLQPFLELLNIKQQCNIYREKYNLKDTLRYIVERMKEHVKAGITEYSSPLYYAVQRAERDYTEAKDRCKATEWEDKKLQLKNENIDKLKANHFGKYFYDYAAYPDKRFLWALVDCFPDAASQYIAEGERAEKNCFISEKMREFYYLQALYCLLHNEDPIPPEFRKQEPTPHSETKTKQKNSNTTQTLDNYTPEERQKIVDCYTGLAGFMGIDTHWITDIFKSDDGRLWAAIKADRQIPLMHPNRNDGTNIAPLLNLLGVLCYSGKLSDKPSSYYNKLSEQLTYLDKNRIASLVKNGNRKEPRGLAKTIKKRLSD